MARKSKWTGRSKLRRKLSIILPKEIKKELQDTIGEAAKIIYHEAQRNTPVRDGDLKSAMKIQHRGDKLAAKVGYFEKGNKRNWKKAGWRAHFTEFGTRGSDKLPAQKAQPFLGPAYLKKRKKVERMIDRGVDKALKKVAHGNFT